MFPPVKKFDAVWKLAEHIAGTTGWTIVEGGSSEYSVVFHVPEGLGNHEDDIYIGIRRFSGYLEIFGSVSHGLDAPTIYIPFTEHAHPVIEAILHTLIPSYRLTYGVAAALEAADQAESKKRREYNLRWIMLYKSLQMAFPSLETMDPANNALQLQDLGGLIRIKTGVNYHDFETCRLELEAPIDIIAGVLEELYKSDHVRPL